MPVVVTPIASTGASVSTPAPSLRRTTLPSSVPAKVVSAVWRTVSVLSANAPLVTTPATPESEATRWS